jgi:hypothetical protein
MTGTVCGALEARRISASPEKLQVEAHGTIEEADGKIILTGIKIFWIPPFRLTSSILRIRDSYSQSWSRRTTVSKAWRILGRFL